MRKVFGFILTASFLLLGASCNSTDCPLNNLVRAYYVVYSSSNGKTTNIPDTLSILAADTTLLNRSVNTATFNLPMGYLNAQDTLYFQFRTATGGTTDTVVIAHTNTPHFVSLDCGTSVFHKITAISNSHRRPTAYCPTAIDSIVISKNTVNYDQTENFKVYISTY